LTGIGIFTLIFGALSHVESFNARKGLGVIASFAGIVLVSTVDLHGGNDENRGNFPHKSVGEIAIGDSMALLSALIYGAYTILLKKRIGHESRADMLVFFGMVGLMNCVLLWPGFLLLHYTGLETFQIPPTGKVWAIILINASVSLISDICWAYAMLLTSPLIVTVGISMTIPLALLGQMIIQSQYSSALYWVGAVVVLGSFVFINYESKTEATPSPLESSIDDEP
jgi:solute carrier family 35, member F5